MAKGHVYYCPNRAFPKRERAHKTGGNKRAFISVLKERGSLTVEAALVIPLWMAGVVALLFFLVAIRTQVTLQTALYHQLMNATAYAYYLNQTDLPAEAIGVLEAETVKFAVIAEVGEKFFDHTFIVNNEGGIWLNLLSEKEDGMIDAALEYQMRPPYDLLGIGTLTLVTRAKCRMWLGESETEEWEEAQMVYVTAEGEVYHTKRDCSYIKVTYSECTPQEIETKRNPDGAKYHLCSYCSKQYSTSQHVYYMTYGTRYHTSLNCQNFHRNVYLIELDDAQKTYRPCSKCAK